MIDISVIVPIYNVEKYIDKCVHSILSQSFKTFELILVDDGSPDKCGNICDQYAREDRRIKVIHKENGGLSSARNAGLEIASGKYVTFVDSDDWIESNMYEEMYAIAEETKADIVQCKFIDAYDENVERIGNNNYKIIDNMEALNNLYNGRYIETVVAWNKLYRKNLFEDIRFPNGKIHEDEFTTYKLLYKSNNIVLLDDQLYYYRQTPNSITHKKFNAKRLDILEASNNRIEFFQEIKALRLVDKTIIRYEEILREFYEMCDNSTNLSGNIVKRIKCDYKKLFSVYMCIKNITLKEKVRGTLFYINPYIYKKVRHIKSKI